MEYKKPAIIKNQDNLPPVTVNFAQPAVGTSFDIEAYRRKVFTTIEKIFGIKPVINDRRISESAKQI